MTVKPRKIFALLLAAALAVTLFPTAAFAAPGDLYVLGGGGGGGQGQNGDGGGGGGGAGGYVGDTNPNGNGGRGGDGLSYPTDGQAGGLGGITGSDGAYGSSGGTGGAGGTGSGIPGATASSGAAGGKAQSGSGTTHGGRGGNGGLAGYTNTGAANYTNVFVTGGNGGNGDQYGGVPGGEGGAASLTMSSLNVSNAITVTSGNKGSIGDAPGLGGPAKLECSGTLSAPSITVTRPSGGGSASATIGTLLVAAGGTTVTNSGSTVSIETVKFDTSSTTLRVAGTVDIGKVSLVPPATAAGQPTAFSALRFSSGTLSVDPRNLSLNPGETITLLRTEGGVPAAWDGLTFGDYKTEVSGFNLLLRRVTNKPPSPLPKTGDGFPLGAVVALLGAGFIAIAIMGMRLRKQRKGE